METLAVEVFKLKKKNWILSFEPPYVIFVAQKSDAGKKKKCLDFNASKSHAEMSV